MTIEEKINAAKNTLGNAAKKHKDNLILGFSHQGEEVVILHLLSTLDLKVRVFTLDTGKLFLESLNFQQAIQKRFNLAIEVFKPDPQAVAALEAEQGERGIYESIENRKRCCFVRKVEPLHRALRGTTGWITGLRRDQAVTRQTLQAVEYDEGLKLHKINPLIDWSEAEVMGYLLAYDLPVNALYDQGFRSIGCAPCTRAVQPGEEARAGRWWWEDPEHKECGLHIKANHGQA